jgi:hypothetical protein
LGLIRFRRRKQQSSPPTWVTVSKELDLLLRRAVADCSTRRLQRWDVRLGTRVLDAEPEGGTAQALLAIQIEDLTEFELQEQLAARRSANPIAFITSSLTNVRPDVLRGCDLLAAVASPATGKVEQTCY